MLSRGQFCPPEDTRQCVATFSVVTTERGGATGISQVEARDATKRPTTKNYLAQKVNNAKKIKRIGGSKIQQNN